MQVSMPSASTSTLSMPSASMSSLSHSMKVRSSMARVVDRHGLVEPLAGEHEAADVLREVAREAEQLARQGRWPGGSRDWPGSSPASRDVLVGDLAVALRPRSVPARPAVTSSVRPMALPTSRIAMRGR